MKEFILILTFAWISVSHAATVNPPTDMDTHALVSLDTADGAGTLFRLLPASAEQHWVNNYTEDHFKVETFERHNETVSCKKYFDSRSADVTKPNFNCNIVISLSVAPAQN
jgi:hypothetical protein